MTIEARADLRGEGVSSARFASRCVRGPHVCFQLDVQFLEGLEQLGLRGFAGRQQVGEPKTFMDVGEEVGGGHAQVQQGHLPVASVRDVVRELTLRETEADTLRSSHHIAEAGDNRW